MREELNKWNTKKLEDKAKEIFKLYARVLNWEGWNIGLLAKNKLEPTPNSWVPQNFVISKYKDGYGIFRVDHTSTRKNENYEPEKLIEKILKDSGLQNLEAPTFGSYTHIPTSILIALNFEFTTGKKPKENKPLFEQAYLYQGSVKSWEKGYGCYLKIYGLAFVSGIKMIEPPEPIQEKMIKEVFEL